MNHPAITRPSSDIRRVLPFCIITAAICSALAFLLLNRESSQHNAPAAVVHPVPNSLGPHGPPLSAEPSTQSTVDTASAPTPVVHTPAEMNRLVDSGFTLEQKLAALTQAMRSADARSAAEAARRAVFLIKSGDYQRLAGPLLLDSTIHPAGMQVLGLNMHDRDPAFTLPLLVKVGAMQGHPLMKEAGDTIAFYLGDSARTLSGDPLDRAVRDWLENCKTARQP